MLKWLRKLAPIVLGIGLLGAAPAPLRAAVTFTALGHTDEKNVTDDSYTEIPNLTFTSGIPVYIFVATNGFEAGNDFAYITAPTMSPELISIYANDIWGDSDLGKWAMYRYMPTSTFSKASIEVHTTGFCTFVSVDAIQVDGGCWQSGAATGNELQFAGLTDAGTGTATAQSPGNTYWSNEYRLSWLLKQGPSTDAVETFTGDVTSLLTRNGSSGGLAINNITSSFGTGYTSDGVEAPYVGGATWTTSRPYALVSMSVIPNPAISVDASRFGLNLTTTFTHDTSTVADGARIFYRRYGSSVAYDSGMAMVRRVGTYRTDGKIIRIPSGVSTEYYLKYALGTQWITSQPATATTRVPFSATPGNTYFVSKSGNDGNPGTQAQPFLTLNHALSAIAGDNNWGSGPFIGGTIKVVGPGIWYETLEVPDDWLGPGNTVSNGFSLIGVGNRDSIIIDQSWPTFLNGKVSGGGNLTWTSLGVDSIYKAYFPSSDSIPSASAVVLGWGELLHAKLSMAELTNDAMGERSGWVVHNDTLYVQRATGGSPSGSLLRASYGVSSAASWGVRLQLSHCYINNLTFRYGTNGIILGTYNGNSGRSSVTTISNCNFYGMQQEAIYGAYPSDSITITGCTFSGLTIGNMSYQANKSRDGEHSNFCLVGGRDWTVYNNTGVQSFNGIASGGGISATDTTLFLNAEIIGNTLTNLRDDGIELDPSHAINTLVMGNIVQKSASMVSIAPIYTGPAFILYNVGHNCRSEGIKLGDGNSAPSWGYALIAHNTITGPAPVIANAGGASGYQHYRNNILVGGAQSGAGAYNYNIHNIATGALSLGVRDTLHTYTNDFNYDMLDSIGTGGRMMQWKSGVYYSIASMRANAAGFVWEKNGNVGRAAYVDSANTDFRLTSSSAAATLGCRLPGINTPMGSTTYYSGAAPFAGAYDVTFTVSSSHRFPRASRPVHGGRTR